MAISDAYASPTEYRARLSKTDTSEDPEILLDLTAVSRYLERQRAINRYFNKDVAVTTRAYVPRRSTRELFVEDIASTAGLVIRVDENNDGTFSETAWATTDYELRPLNADKGPEARPWTEIAIPSWSTKSPFSPSQRVQVTAIHGWPAVPEAIKRATIELTGILRLESPRATERVAEGLESSFSMSKSARSIVADLAQSYGRPSVFV